MLTGEAKRAADRDYYQRNKAGIIARVRAYASHNRESIRAAKRERYRENRDQVLAKVRAYAAQNRETVLERRRRHYRKNHATERAQQHAYSLANKEAIAVGKARWGNADRRLHPEKYAAHSQTRRARLLGAFGERVVVSVLVRRDRGRCGLCSKRVAKRDRSIDHIVPLSRGGEHSYRNTQLAHRLCNISKGTKVRGQLRLTG